MFDDIEIIRSEVMGRFPDFFGINSLFNLMETSIRSIAATTFRSARKAGWLVIWVITFVLSGIMQRCVEKHPLITAYDARVNEDEILTPLPPTKPRINGPSVYGCTANKPLVYRIPTQGERPIAFSVVGLPESLVLDAENGIFTGMTPAKDGDYTMTITAENRHGHDTRELTLVVGNRLALTPPMGWNHWYTHYHYVNDRNIRDAAAAMVQSGMADVGYSYVSIDDCWMRIAPEYVERAMTRKGTGNVNLDTAARMGTTRDETGKIIPNDAFPDMDALTDYIHGFGLKAGLYTSPGPRTCQEFEGSWQHEAIDAKTYADWGFDLLKYDWCRYREIFAALPEAEQTREAYIKPYHIMGDLLKEQGRDIVHNLCQYGMADVWTWGKEVGHSWRTGGDLGHTITQGGIYNIAKKTIGIRSYNGPGGWNDPDYIILGKWRSPFNKGGDLLQIELTPNEQYSYMSLWGMMACPLFFSGDMDALDPFTLKILSNTEMIAVNQDVLGVCAEPVRMNEEEWILKKSMSDGSVIVGFFEVPNKGDRTIEVTWDELGVTGAQALRDPWRQKDIGYADEKLSITVGKRGCAVLKFMAVE